MIPEIGNLLVLPKEFHNVTWYGRGPEENYIDRKTGYNVGLYQSTVEDFFVDYIKPQETGNRTDVRWVSMTNDDGIGLLVQQNGYIRFVYSFSWHGCGSAESNQTTLIYRLKDGKKVTKVLAEITHGVLNHWTNIRFLQTRLMSILIY